MMQDSQLKKILLALQQLEPKILDFFVSKNALADEFNEKTIRNAFDPHKGMSKRLYAFFETYIPQPHGDDFSFDSLADTVKNLIISQNKESEECRELFSNVMKRGSTKEHVYEIEESAYIGKMQDPALEFHKEESQNAFFDLLRTSIIDRFRIRKHQSNRVDNQPADFKEYALPSIKIDSIVLNFAYIEVVRVHASLSKVKIELSGSMTPPPPSTTNFAARAMRPGAYDGPSFGVRNYSFNEQKKDLFIELQWTTYFRSLECCDSKFMTAIYCYGKESEKAAIRNYVATASAVFDNKGGSFLPIFGVTTAVIFRREAEGPYWTFVQLKEGGVSRIIESHLTPSFVHQPSTKMAASLTDEAADISFHIRRELCEEIFNFRENASPDYEYYKSIINRHPAIKSLDALIAQKKAELFCHGLIFDTHRSKYELINVLRIDCPTWFNGIAEDIDPNHESIAGGVVLAPLTEKGIQEALTGSLTYTRPIRRMCCPGTAALAAAIQHLKQRDDKNVRNIEFTSTII